jgi:hypothetical protein
MDTIKIANTGNAAREMCREIKKTTYESEHDFCLLRIIVVGRPALMKKEKKEWGL